MENLLFVNGQNNCSLRPFIKPHYIFAQFIESLKIFNYFLFYGHYGLIFIRKLRQKLLESYKYPILLPIQCKLFKHHPSEATFIIIMNSFVQANEQTVVDFNTIVPKVREHQKSYSFFIYYLKSQVHPNSTHLQRLAFKLKEEKSWSWDKQEHGRLIHMFFIDLENEHEVEQSFFDLKNQLQQSLKSKLIFYSRQYNLLEIINRAVLFGIDLNNSPIALYSSNVHPDLSQHLGWRDSQLGELALHSNNELDVNTRKWISSPGEKIDMWGVSIAVDPEEGVIMRKDGETNAFQPINERVLKQSFLSHMSIGYHSQLVANYEARRKDQTGSFVDKFVFNLQSFKTFCCIGKPSLETSTGIVSVMFKDDKGYEQEITKQLREQEGKRGIMTLVLSNIDRFQGVKLRGGRINDSKLQIGVFQSSSGWRLVSPSNGEIKIKLKAAQVYMQVNSTCLKLINPTNISINLERKVKVLINKDTLQC